MENTYLRSSARERLKEFFRCVEITRRRKQQLKREVVESKPLKAFRVAIDSTLNCDYVQGVKIQRYNTLKTY